MLENSTILLYHSIMSRKRSRSVSIPEPVVSTNPARITSHPEIVLYLSAHGDQSYEAIDYDQFPGLQVSMLSFVHKYGQYGEMKLAPFENIVDTLDELAIKVTLDNLRQRYERQETHRSKEVRNSPLLRSVTKANSKTSKSKGRHKRLDVTRNRKAPLERSTYIERMDLKDCVEDILPSKLKTLYVRAFKNDALDDLTEHEVREHQESLDTFMQGFAVVQPIKDRSFQFKRNPDENLEFEPHYGIHVMDVSHLNDQLASFSGFRTYHHLQHSYDFGNITAHERLRYSSIDIQKNKKIIVDAITNNTSGEIQEECIFKYYKMAQLEGASLSDIYYLFYHIGFTTIYLIDPSCRALDKNSRLQTLRPRTDKIINLPANYTSQESFNPTQDSQQLIPESQLFSQEMYRPTDSQMTSAMDSQDQENPADETTRVTVRSWFDGLQQLFSPVRRRSSRSK